MVCDRGPAAGNACQVDTCTTSTARICLTTSTTGNQATQLVGHIQSTGFRSNTGTPISGSGPSHAIYPGRAREASSTACASLSSQAACATVTRCAGSATITPSTTRSTGHTRG